MSSIFKPKFQIGDKVFYLATKIHFYRITLKNDLISSSVVVQVYLDILGNIVCRTNDGQNLSEKILFATEEEAKEKVISMCENIILRMKQK